MKQLKRKYIANAMQNVIKQIITSLNDNAINQIAYFILKQNFPIILTDGKFFYTQNECFAFWTIEEVITNDLFKKIHDYVNQNYKQLYNIKILQNSGVLKFNSAAGCTAYKPRQKDFNIYNRITYASSSISYLLMELRMIDEYIHPINLEELFFEFLVSVTEAPVFGNKEVLNEEFPKIIEEYAE